MTDRKRPPALRYRRCRFVAALPLDYLYSPSHFWIARQADGTWRVGMTKFATRLLGETVEMGFSIGIGYQWPRGKSSAGWRDSSRFPTFAPWSRALSSAGTLVSERIFPRSTKIRTGPVGFMRPLESRSRLFGGQGVRRILDAAIIGCPGATRFPVLLTGLRVCYEMGDAERPVKAPLELW